MTRPIFFSVGGKHDSDFAKTVASNFNEELYYHYQLTGEENTNFQQEINQNISTCKIFVVFWSNDWLNSEHARLELALFKKLHENSSDDVELIIVPTDANPPDIQSEWNNPINSKKEFVFGSWRLNRSIDNASDSQRIAEIIKNSLYRNNIKKEIIITRGWLLDEFSRTVEAEDFKKKELVFVVGLEGHGRKTTIKQFMSQSYPNRTVRNISIDSIEGPEDFLQYLIEALALTKLERDTIISKASLSNDTNYIKEIRKLIHYGREQKSYFILSIDKYTQTDTDIIPSWLADTLSVFETGNTPLIYITVSNIIDHQVDKDFPEAGVIRIPGLEEKEMRELIHLLSLEDPNPSRWSKTEKEYVLKASAHNPSLCNSIMRIMARERNLDHLQRISERAEIKFSESISALTDHLMTIYKDKISDLYALRVTEKLGITSKSALDEILQPIIQQYGDYDLYTLRAYGLIEQLSDGIYRIPALIQRRLGSSLWSSIEIKKVDDLFFEFSKNLTKINEDNSTIYLRNAAIVKMRTDSNIPDALTNYVTVASLLKSSIDRYSNNKFYESHNLANRAIEKIKIASLKTDTTLQIEVARYKGLSGIRIKNNNSMKEACKYLEENFLSTNRSKAAQAISFFLKGFERRFNAQPRPAIDYLLNSLSLIKDQKRCERQRAAIYTELSFSYLQINPSDPPKAVSYAKKGYEENNVVHTLNAYIKSLNELVSNKNPLEDDYQSNIRNIEILLKELETRSSKVGRKSFFYARKREYDAIISQNINYQSDIKEYLESAI